MYGYANHKIKIISHDNDKIRSLCSYDNDKNQISIQFPVTLTTKFRETNQH